MAGWSAWNLRDFRTSPSSLIDDPSLKFLPKSMVKATLESPIRLEVWVNSTLVTLAIAANVVKVALVGSVGAVTGNTTASVRVEKLDSHKLAPEPVQKVTYAFESVAKL